MFAEAANVVAVDAAEIIVVPFVLVVVVVVDVVVVVVDVLDDVATAAVSAAFAKVVVDVVVSSNAAIFVDRSVAEFVRVAVVRHHPCYYAAAAIDAETENVVETWDEEVTIKKTYYYY